MFFPKLVPSFLDRGADRLGAADAAAVRDALSQSFGESVGKPVGAAYGAFMPLLKARLGAAIGEKRRKLTGALLNAAGCLALAALVAAALVACAPCSRSGGRREGDGLGRHSACSAVGRRAARTACQHRKQANKMQDGQERRAV